MSYPKRQARLRPRRGVSSDLPLWDVPPDFFTQAANIVFRMGIAERAPSKRSGYETVQTGPLAILNAQLEGINFWIYQSNTKTYAVEATNHSDITPLSGINAAADCNFHWSVGTLNGVPFINNSFEEPWYWTGQVTDKLLPLPDWPAGERAKVMVAHRFHLFAMNIEGAGNLPSKVMWSDAAPPGSVPDSWTSSNTNEAGAAQLSDTPGEIISAMPLRGSLMIYKNGATHVADYIGLGEGAGSADEIFAFRTLFVQAGALARHAVADINGRHFIVTDGDIVVTDGTNIRSVAQNRRKRNLFNQLDQANYEKLFVVYHRAKGEVWVCFPEAGNDLCTRAMIYDVANDAWGDRDLQPGISMGATGIVSDDAPSELWDDIAELWDNYNQIWNNQNFSLATQSLVLADSVNEKLFVVDAGDESFTSTLTRHSLDFGEPERFKTVKRVHFRIDGDTAIPFTVRVGTQETAEDSISWSAPVPVSSDTGYANFIAAGRFISVEIEATTEQTFKVTGLDIEYELRGYF